MKLQITKRLFAFIITMMMFSSLPQLLNAQHCQPGQFLVCDANGKHCKCYPCHHCGSFLADKTAANERSLAIASVNTVSQPTLTALSKYAFNKGENSLVWRPVGVNEVVSSARLKLAGNPKIELLIVNQ